MHRQFSRVFPGNATLQRGFRSRAGARHSQGRYWRRTYETDIELPINRGDEGLDILLRVYAPDFEKMKTWKAPHAVQVQ